MEHFKSRLAWLFFRYQQGICTDEERMEFLDMVTKEENQEELNRLFKDAIAETDIDQVLDPVKADQIYNAIVTDTKTEVSKSSLVKKMGLKKIIVAASVILLISLGVYQMIPVDSKRTAIVQNNNNGVKTIKPGTDNAILTLSDGSTIVLDKAADGSLAYQGSVEVKKINGQIKYQGTNGTEQLYNTISTARGNQYQVVLSDGSKVWLDAASSIRFPTSFNGKERKVEITGQAYFEVAHNPDAPFKVDVNGLQITVLGTHFNVNAYGDEAEIKTTLLEGSVKLSKGNLISVLKPGQQGSVGSNGNIAVQNDVDVDEVVAWKNGAFIFNRQDMKSIMRQISRWYDVDVVYNGEPTKETFSGIVSRKTSVDQVLKIMEANGARFTIEGRKIIVQ